MCVCVYVCMVFVCIVYMYIYKQIHMVCLSKSVYKHLFAHMVYMCKCVQANPNRLLVLTLGAAKSIGYSLEHTMLLKEEHKLDISVFTLCLSFTFAEDKGQSKYQSFYTHIRTNPYRIEHVQVSLTLEVRLHLKT